MGAPQAVLSADALRQRAAQAADWKVVDQHHIARTFKFPDFLQALDFVNRVGAVAERQGHHPDIHLAYGRVDVETWTHDAGGITEKDFQLASEIDRLKTLVHRRVERRKRLSHFGVQRFAFPWGGRFPLPTYVLTA